MINWIKKHPYMTAIIVLIGGIVFYLIYTRSAKNAAAQTSSGQTGGVVMGTPANSQAAYAAQASEAQTQAQLQALQSKYSTSLNALTNQLNATVQEQQNAETSAQNLAYLNNTAQEALTQIQGGVSEANTLTQAQAQEYQSNQAAYAQTQTAFYQTQAQQSIAQGNLAEQNAIATQMGNYAASYAGCPAGDLLCQQAAASANPLGVYGATQQTTQDVSHVAAPLYIPNAIPQYQTPNDAAAFPNSANSFNSNPFGTFA